MVRWGDTVYSIARRFGVTVDAIVWANNLANPNYIRVGQVLIIPTVGPQPTPTPGPGAVTYVVQRGDNLYRIALRFGTTVEAIAAANHIVNPWYIYVGQVLIIPSGTAPPSGRTHIVRPGDTLYAIAALYRVSLWSIIALNNIVNPNLIYVGQVLRIP